MAKKLSTFDRLALMPTYALERMRRRGKNGVLTKPKNPEYITVNFSAETWSGLRKLAAATSFLVGFKVSPDQAAVLLMEIFLKTSSKKELKEMFKSR